MFKLAVLAVCASATVLDTTLHSNPVRTSLLKRMKTLNLQGEVSKDATLFLLSDYKQVVKVLIGANAHEVSLVPDTRLDDVIIVTDQCENCTTGAEKWKNSGRTPKGEHDTSLTYFD